MAVSSNDSQNFGFALILGMNVQTVQIVSGFFGRNGKLRAVDNVFQLVFAHCEVNRQLVARNNRKVFDTDGRQRKL